MSLRFSNLAKAPLNSGLFLAQLAQLLPKLSSFASRQQLVPFLILPKYSIDARSQGRFLFMTSAKKIDTQ
jgi:hypothetical protein